MTDVDNQSKTYVCTAHPNLKFSLPVKGVKERFAFKNGQLVLTDPIEIEALDAELTRPKSTMHRFIRVVSLEMAEKLVSQLKEKMPKNVVARGGATTAALDLVRKQNQENAETKLRAQGLSEPELDKARVAFEKENFVVTETKEIPEAGAPAQDFSFLKSKS